MSRFAVVQLNSIPGDLTGNSQRVLSALNQALSQGDWGSDDWIVFSFGSLSGWPLEELQYNPGFVIAYDQARKQLMDALPESAQKTNLVFRHPGVPVPFAPWECGSGKNPILVEMNPRPFAGNAAGRYQSEFLQLCVQKTGWGIFCNPVGGQDSLIYPGGSFVCDSTGKIVAQARRWESSILLFDTVSGQSREWTQSDLSADSRWQEQPVLDVVSASKQSADAQNARLSDLYFALTLGIRDYVTKNGFRGAIVGLSGGIDSALVAALAVGALGREKVTGVTMPSQYSSLETRSDAQRLASLLGIEMFSLPIVEPYEAFCRSLTESLNRFDSSADPQNLTDQNLQARIRGVYLMSLSNRSGRVVLNTSNKSEAAVGYGTLYGDLVGGLGVISDVWKTDVWALSTWINQNAGQERIPVSTINRVPSAELREGQQDRDSIPDYPVLDPIMQRYIGQGKTIEQIAADGFKLEDVEKCVRLFNRNEFKRRQCVPGLIVSSSPLSSKKRPMTNKFFR